MTNPKGKYRAPLSSTDDNNNSTESSNYVLRLRKIQAICSRDLSQSFEIEFGRDKRVPLMPKVLS